MKASLDDPLMSRPGPHLSLSEPELGEFEYAYFAYCAVMHIK